MFKGKEITRGEIPRPATGGGGRLKCRCTGGGAEKGRQRKTYPHPYAELATSAGCEKPKGEFHRQEKKKKRGQKGGSRVLCPLARLFRGEAHHMIKYLKKQAEK